MPRLAGAVLALCVTVGLAAGDGQRATAAGVCPTCDDGIACTQDTCVDGTTCDHVPLDARCDDGNSCTINVCDIAAGGCRETLAPGCCLSQDNCDDGRVCTIDRCNTSGRCEYETRTDCCDTNLACDDGNACTVDRCDLSAGECSYAPIAGCCRRDKDCVATVPCQVGSCDTSNHACRWSVAPDGAECRDFDPCSLNEQCLGGSCIAAATATCQSDLPCVQGACATGLGCVYENKTNCCGSDADCDDGVVCTADVCDGLTGQCRNIALEDCCLGDIDCDDNRRCTTDRCDSDHVCRHTTPDPTCCEDDAECDDGNACTINRCDVDARTCLPTRVTAEGAACDDGDACTQETFCRGGACEGVPRMCDDGSTCTTDSCDSSEGCSATPIAGCCKSDADCPSGDQCNLGYCDLGTGDCRLRPFPNRSVCDDGDSCTSNDSCLEGACVGTASLCDDGDPCTTDICEVGGGCQHAPVEGCCIDDAACDDADVCNGAERCVSSLCVPGAPPPCDDWDACTVDSCLPDSGCVNARLGVEDDPACAWRECGGNCDDGDPCTNDVCERVTGVCQHLPRYAPPDCALPAGPSAPKGCGTGPLPELPAALLLAFGALLVFNRRRTS